MMLHTTTKSKHFAERLNKCLDDLGVPKGTRNRLPILSRMLNISRQQTRMLIEGYPLTDERAMQRLEVELDIDSTAWQ